MAAERKCPSNEMAFHTWLLEVRQAYAAGQADWVGAGVRVRRMSAGANNALYRLDTGEGRVMCKLCVPDERRRAQREFACLSLLQEIQPGLAPRPLLLDESCQQVPYPVVIYTWVEGESLRPPLSQVQLAAFIEAMQATHACRAAEMPGAVNILPAWFHWFAAEPYLSELQALLGQYELWLAGSGDAGKALAERIRQLVARCRTAVSGMDVSLRSEQVPACLCHVDSNLGNMLWTSEMRLCLIDWEYGGWGDPALDLAELRWHASLEGLTNEQQEWLRLSYQPPPEDGYFWKRVNLWDHILSTRWVLLIVRLLWSQANGPDRLRLGQAGQADAGNDRCLELWARLERFLLRAERLMGI